MDLIAKMHFFFQITNNNAKKMSHKEILPAITIYHFIITKKTNNHPFDTIKKCNFAVEFVNSSLIDCWFLFTLYK